MWTYKAKRAVAVPVELTKHLERAVDIVAIDVEPNVTNDSLDLIFPEIAGAWTDNKHSLSGKRSRKHASNSGPRAVIMM